MEKKEKDDHYFTMDLKSDPCTQTQMFCHFGQPYLECVSWRSFYFVLLQQKHQTIARAQVCYCEREWLKRNAIREENGALG